MTDPAGARAPTPKTSSPRTGPRPAQRPAGQGRVEPSDLRTGSWHYPAYAAAKTVKFYIDVRCEVSRNPSGPRAGRRRSLGQNDRQVPCCNYQGELELFHLTDIGRTAVAFRILERNPSFARFAKSSSAEPDWTLVMVPGGAFDRSGGRMGPRQGLITTAAESTPRPDAPLSGRWRSEANCSREIPMFPPRHLHEHGDLRNAGGVPGGGRRSDGRVGRRELARAGPPCRT